MISFGSKTDNNKYEFMVENKYSRFKLKKITIYSQLTFTKHIKQHTKYPLWSFDKNAKILINKDNKIFVSGISHITN